MALRSSFRNSPEYSSGSSHKIAANAYLGIHSKVPLIILPEIHSRVLPKDHPRDFSLVSPRIHPKALLGIICGLLRSILSEALPKILSVQSGNHLDHKHAHNISRNTSMISFANSFWNSSCRSFRYFKKIPVALHLKIDLETFPKQALGTLSRVSLDFFQCAAAGILPGFALELLPEITRNASKTSFGSFSDVPVGIHIGASPDGLLRFPK